MAVTADEVAISLGRPISTAAETDQVEQWITDARMLIRIRLGDLDLLDQDVLDYVVREAVALKVKRPDPASTTTVAVDDASVTKRYERDTGQIQILDGWWDMLSPTVQSRAFSTRPGFQSDYCGPYSRWGVPR